MLLIETSVAGYGNRGNFSLKILFTSPQKILVIISFFFLTYIHFKSRSSLYYSYRRSHYANIYRERLLSRRTLMQNVFPTNPTARQADWGNRKQTRHVRGLEAHLRPGEDKRSLNEGGVKFKLNPHPRFCSCYIEHCEGRNNMALRGWKVRPRKVLGLSSGPRRHFATCRVKCRVAYTSHLGQGSCISGRAFKLSLRTRGLAKHLVALFGRF